MKKTINQLTLRQCELQASQLVEKSIVQLSGKHIVMVRVDDSKAMSLYSDPTVHFPLSEPFDLQVAEGQTVKIQLFSM